MSTPYWSVKCQDPDCLRWGGFHLPDRDDGAPWAIGFFIVHEGQGRRTWRQSVAEPTAEGCAVGEVRS